MRLNATNEKKSKEKRSGHVQGMKDAILAKETGNQMWKPEQATNCYLVETTTMIMMMMMMVIHPVTNATETNLPVRLQICKYAGTLSVTYIFPPRSETKRHDSDSKGNLVPDCTVWRLRVAVMDISQHCHFKFVK
jgi:hypothetical protein